MGQQKRDPFKSRSCSRVTEREAMVGKLLIITSVAVSVGVVGSASAATKMSLGACKTRIMQDSRNLDSTNRNYCGRGCMVKVRACMQGA
jgi:hypothetical protein